MQRHLLLSTTTCTLGMAMAQGQAAHAATPQAAPPLAAYLGKYPFDRVRGISFRQHPQVVAALAVTLPASAADIQRALATTDVVDRPIRQLSANRLYASSYDPAGGGVVNWAILITLDGRQAAVCYSDDAVYGNGSSNWYFQGKKAFSSSGPCPSDKQDLEAALGAWPLGARPK